MSYTKTQAIVINKKSFKETDFIITALTDQLGKISFIAKGANKFTSLRNSSLQLGNIVTLDLFQKNDMYWLSEVKTIKSFVKTRKSLNQIKFLFYFLELINQLVAEKQITSNLYKISTKAIESIENKSFSGFVDSEMQFIDILGFGLPKNLTSLVNKKDYLACQQALTNHIQQILEKPLQTPIIF